MKEAKADSQKTRGEEPRIPSSLWLWLKADLFKRIVSPLANLPVASEAEHDGANVMRVVQYSCLHGGAAVSSREKIMKDALISPQTLTTEWSSTSEHAETHPLDGWMPRMPISK